MTSSEKYHEFLEILSNICEFLDWILENLRNIWDNAYKIRMFNQN